MLLERPGAFILLRHGRQPSVPSSRLQVQRRFNPRPRRVLLGANGREDHAGKLALIDNDPTSPNGHAGSIEQCPLSGEQRKRYAQFELFRV